ncbi:MAG TPA: RNA methyltransferase [Candidatus Limnocylindrales bacterium]
MTGPSPAPLSGGILTSTKNPRVRAAIGLRDRRTRDETGLTLVDGVRELARALAGRAQAIEVFVVEHALDEAGAAAVELARSGGAAIVPVTAGVLDRLGYGERSEGVVATVRIPDVSLGRLSAALPADPLIVVLEAVEKPGNLGAVLRSADAAGADAVIVADPRTDLFNPNAIRASLGTVFAVPVGAGTAADVRAWLDASRVRVLAARVGAAIPYTDADLRGPVALVLGSEAEGLTDAWTGQDVTAVSLPMLGVADSLNVSVTAAVLLYEARRQRGARVTEA